MDLFDMIVPPAATVASIATAGSNLVDVVQFHRDKSTGVKRCATTGRQARG